MLSDAAQFFPDYTIMQHFWTVLHSAMTCILKSFMSLMGHRYWASALHQYIQDVLNGLGDLDGWLHIDMVYPLTPVLTGPDVQAYTLPQSQTISTRINSSTQLVAVF